MIAYARVPACPACGRELNDADARFCAGCGSPLGEAPPPSPVILSAVDALDPQDAPTRFGLQRTGGDDPGGALGPSTTRTRRSRRVGRPAPATRGARRPSSYAAPRPIARERVEPYLDLAASRGIDGPTPEPEPFPARGARFDGDPFFEDVFREDAPAPPEAPTNAGQERPDEAMAHDEADAEELDAAGIRRGRRARALAGLLVALGAIGTAIALAV